MLTPSVNVVQSSFAEEQQGEISGLSRSVSNLGSSLGTAIAGTILVAGLTSHRAPTGSRWSRWPSSASSVSWPRLMLPRHIDARVRPPRSCRYASQPRARAGARACPPDPACHPP